MLLVSVSTGWVRQAETLTGMWAFSWVLNLCPREALITVRISGIVCPWCRTYNSSLESRKHLTAVIGKDAGSLDKVRNPNQLLHRKSHPFCPQKFPHRNISHHFETLGWHLIVSLTVDTRHDAHQRNSSPGFTEHPLPFLPLPLLPLVLFSLFFEAPVLCLSWRSGTTCETVERCIWTNALVSMEDSNTCN